MSEYFIKPIVKTLMLKGQEGQSIKGITKTNTSGLVDTYTVTLTDGTTSTFTVTNGKGIASIKKTGARGLEDIYTTTYNDGTTSTFTVTNGEGLQNLQVGGRNLLLNSGGAFTMGFGIPNTTWNKSTGKTEISLPVETTGSEILPMTASFERYLPLSIGGTYTQSITVETDANIIGDNFKWSWFDNDTGHHFEDCKITSTGKVYTLSSTYTIGESESGTVRIMDIYLLKFFDLTTGTYLRLYHPKIERGNVATDWTLAPEDLAESIQLSNQDLNDYTGNAVRFLYAAGGNTVKNVPSGVTAFGVYCYRSAFERYTQELSDTNGKKYIRTYNGQSWTSWRTIIDSSNVAGYKVNNSGYADSAGNASKVNNHTVNADVPSGAKFTDTTYSEITNAKIDSICV